jgi:acyl dehydratase
MNADWTPPPCPFEIGETFQQSLIFDVESIRLFATMVGDTNPLHHDEDYARKTRFGGLIASGGHYSALMMGAVAKNLAMRSAGLGLEFTFQFRKAVHAGSIMKLEWRIVEIEPKASLNGHILTLEGKLIAPNGIVAVCATSKGVVMPLDRLQSSGGNAPAPTSKARHSRRE